MSLKQIVTSSQYTVQLQKIVPQRGEHAIAMLRYTKRYYKNVFVNIYTFKFIPFHFNEVYHAVLRKGREVDGSVYGTYALTLHGRGKKYGLQGSDCRYKAGCKFTFDSVKGIKVRRKSIGNQAFNHLLSTIDEVNDKLHIGK